ncbi:integumentary mucin C.1-like [Mytilus trossulus]|uniref:integumentary mucin C.1-like n=1 Tax=Mytilus trossulus TaxID=6551 RepID=UPI0030045DFD
MTKKPREFGLIILLFIVKHGNAAVATPTAAPPTAAPPTSVATTTTALPAATKITTVNTASTTITPPANVTSKLPMNTTTSSPSSTTVPTGPTQTTVPKTTPTTTTTTPKPPDTCYMYEISCNKAACPDVYENKTVHFPNNVKMCDRTDTGYCFVNKIVDSKNESIANYTMGCITSCTNQKNIFGCCRDHLCNKDLSLLNSGQYVKYNFLMSVICIAISLF